MADQPGLTKTELLAAMRQGWDDLHAYLATLSEAQITQPADAAGWTVKDHVIHLAVWEGSLNAFLQKQSRPAYMGVDQATWQSGEVDRINAVIYQRHQDLSWAEVQQTFRRVHEELIGRIEALSEEDLQRPYHYYQPDSSATDAAASRISVATFRHYAKHIPWIKAILLILA
jgi:hypothetical protein